MKDLTILSSAKPFVNKGSGPRKIGAMRKNPRINNSMTPHFEKPEITGTRTGYVIRFTCPLCHAENFIVNKTPKDHYKEARDASCAQCRKRSRVLTPRTNRGPGYSPVSSYNGGRAPQ